MDYWEELAPLLHLKKIPAKTELLAEGSVSNTIYFVKKGSLRLWNNDEGDDITFQFFLEEQGVSSFESFYLQKPSLFSIETLEDCELFLLKKKDLDGFMGNNPHFNTILTEIICERFIDYTHYFLSRIKNSPEERYLELIQAQPQLLERVSHHYIASYLGITPVSLSRIRKRLEK